MGEIISKSQGKVYVGDVCDFQDDENNWRVAEIISVDENGLTVVTHSSNGVQRGNVCYLDFRQADQKRRVRPAGTFTGRDGLDAASSRDTTTIASVAPSTPPSVTLTSSSTDFFSTATSSFSPTPGSLSTSTTLSQPSIHLTQFERPAGQRMSVASSSTGFSSNPHQNDSASQRHLLKKYTPDTLVDVLCNVRQGGAGAGGGAGGGGGTTPSSGALSVEEPRWMCAKVVHSKIKEGEESSVLLTLHILGNSSYEHMLIDITLSNEALKLAQFGSKALLD